MRLTSERRSHARTPSNPFHAPPKSVLFDIVLPAVALALMLASWVAAYVALVSADPTPAHRLHIATTQR